MAKLLTGTRIYGTGTVDTQLIVNGTEQATSTATGALEVVGGVGVGGSLFVGGIVTATNLVRITNATQASATNTGALTIAGGVGIGQDLRVGGTVYGNIVGTITGIITSATNIDSGSIGQVPFQEAIGVTKFFGPGTAGQLLVSAGASSTGPVYTNTSSIYVGRASLANELAGGAAGSIPYQTADSDTTFLGLGTAGFVMLAGVSAPVWVSTSTLVVGKASLADGILMRNETSDSVVNYVTFVSTTTGYTTLKGSAMSGLVYRPSTGDLGVGTGNPLYKLHVSESTDKIAARIDRATTGDILQLYNGSGSTSGATQLSFLHKDSATSAITASRISGYVTSLAAGVVSGGLALSVSNAGTISEAARFDNLGNFGLGNNAPAYRLDVTGGARITGITTITNATQSISVSSGALQVTGGAGIGGNLYVGGTIYGTFNGAITGNASTASTIITETRSTNAEHFLTFVDSNNVSPTAESLYTTANIALNPSTGELRVGGPILQVNSTFGTLATTYNLVNTTATTINFAQAATTLTMGAVSGTTTVRNNLTVAGNLTVQGTTTQVNSTVTNVSDPIFTIGTGPLGADPLADDNKDRGIAFKWRDATTARTGFFGYDDSTGFMTFVPIATLTNEVVSGTKGAMDVNLAGGTDQSIVYQSAASTTAYLAAGTAGFILQTNSTGSAPSWVNPNTLSAGIADQVKTTARTTNSAHYLTFVDSNNVSATAETVYTTSSFVINPGTGNLGISFTPSAWYNSGNLQLGAYSALYSNGAIGANELATNVYRSAASTYNYIVNNFASVYRQQDGKHIWLTAPTGTASAAATLSQNMTLDANGVLLVGNTTLAAGFSSFAQIEASGATGGVLINSATGNIGRLIFTNNNTNTGEGLIRYDGSNQSMQFWTNATQRALFDNAGGLSIGTTTSSSRLTVAGGNGIYINGSGAAGYNVLQAENDLAVRLSAGVGGSTASGWAQNLAHIGSTTNHPFILGANNTERIRISTTGAIAFNGAANFGTSGQFLQSNGNAPPTWANATSIGAGQVSTVTRSTNATHYLTFVDSDNVGATPESIYTTAKFTVNPGTGLVEVTGSATATTVNSQSMVQRLLSATGNSNALEFSNVRGTTGSDWTTAGFRIQQKVDSTWMGFMQFNGTASGVNSGGISFGTGTATANANAVAERMRITPTGDVGIGTVTPNTRLSVQAAGSNGIALLQDTGTATSSGRLFFQASGGTYALTNVGNVLQFASGATVGSSSGTARMVLNSGGFLGLGTTLAPLTYLDVRHNNSSTLAPQLSGITLRTANGHGMEYHMQHSNGYTGWVAAARVGANTSSFGSGFLEWITAGSSGGNQVSVMALHGNGNVSIGSTAAPDYKLFVNGSFAATTKSFVIDHPTKTGHKLRYGSLEGPENGVYVRGRLKDNNVIELPDYWTGLVDEDSITVDLTPVGKHQTLYVEDIVDNTVIVGAGSDQPVNCFYTVWAERKDVDKLLVEYKEQEI